MTAQDFENSPAPSENSTASFAPKVQAAIDADEQLYDQVRLIFTDITVTIKPAIARWNPDWGRALRGLAEPYRLPLIAGKLTRETEFRILAEALAKTVVTGWSTDREGYADLSTQDLLEREPELLRYVLNYASDPITFVLGEYHGRAAGVRPETDDPGD